MLRLRRGGPRTRRRRVVGRMLAGLSVVVVLLAAWIVVPALTAPGNDGLAARIAESARDRGFGNVVTALEALQYRLSPPAEGGTLDPSVARSLAADAGQGATEADGRHPTPGTPSTAVLLQPPVVPPASPALPGEGDYTAQVLVRGQPAVQTALVRPDAKHTSYLAGIAWMSGRLLRFTQHPGAVEPGRLSSWRQPPTIPVADRALLAATFNGGFKMADSRGGYYADGTTAGALRPGAASFVVYTDGHVDIGAWGTEVTKTPQVASVRQNLDLLVDAGVLTPDALADVRTTWGQTLGSAAFVWRSGVGVTAAGDVVYVAGPAMSARTLAVLLQRAGAVRAMELDINPAWVSFMWYGSAHGTVTPHKLVDFSRPADRYFSVNSRDFVAASAR